MVARFMNLVYHQLVKLVTHSIVLSIGVLPSGAPRVRPAGDRPPPRIMYTDVFRDEILCLSDLGPRCFAACYC